MAEQTSIEGLARAVMLAAMQTFEETLREELAARLQPIANEAVVACVEEAVMRVKASWASGFDYAGQQVLVEGKVKVSSGGTDQ